MTKKIAALLLVFVGATPAMAQDTLPRQLSSCLAIPGVLQRLACYDRVAHGVGGTITAAPRTVPVERPMARTMPPAAYAAPPVVMGAPSSLGSERLPQTSPAAPKRAQDLTAMVASISYDPRGRFTVTLDNGQVWRQLEGDTSVLQGARNATVRISRGALGSYDLNVMGRNATYRVLRLQ